MILKQQQQHPRLMKKQQEKALLDADKSVKNYEKLHRKAQKQSAKVDKSLTRHNTTSIPPTRQNGPKAASEVAADSKPYSAYVTVSSAGNRSVLSGVAKRIMKKQRSQETSNGANGRNTTRSLSSTRRTNGMPDGGRSTNHPLSRALSEPELRLDGGSTGGSFDEDTEDSGTSSIFERPGFGSVAFFRRPSAAMMSLPREHSSCEDESTTSTTVPNLSDAERSDQSGATVVRTTASYTESIGSLGSLPARMLAEQRQDYLWNEEDGSSLDSDSGVSDTSPLDVFLLVHGLSDYLGLLIREQIDMAALMLLTDRDLKDLGFPLGPRRKLLNAVGQRKETFDRPGIIIESIL